MALRPLIDPTDCLCLCLDAAAAGALHRVAGFAPPPAGLASRTDARFPAWPPRPAQVPASPVVDWPGAGRALGLVPLPQSYSTARRVIGSEGPGAVSGARLADLVDAVVSESGARLAFNEPIRPLALAARPGDGPTTVDREGVRIGLHVDAWSGLPVTARHDAQNRLCLNLGTAPRWLVFSPFLLDRVSRWPAPERRVTRDADHLLLRPGLRLEANLFAVPVPPGWAYVAPTENLLHDGWAHADEDVTLTLRGRVSERSLGRDWRPISAC